MWLNKALLFLLLVSVALPSGHCCRGRCTRATFLAVGSAVASGIATGIVTYWDKFQTNIKTEIKEFSWSALGWFTGKAQQKQTEGNFPPIKLVLDPPRHNCIIRSEELTQLKELFDSFDTSTDDKVVYAVHLVGLPGSGKSELARQYGNLVFKNGDVHTVITLNTESEKQFKDDIVDALLALKAAKGTHPTQEEFSKKAIQSLVYELRVLMRERPGWLLIVDNIREATQRSFYEELPKPGTERWGQGYMLLTTQVLIRKKGQFVEIKSTNEGMTPNDAKQFLCELVRRAKGDCPDGDAETIVRKLEYLPLAILAAGTFIEEKMKLKLYTLADYQEKFDEENAKAFDILMSDYPHSMQTALLLAVRNKVGGDSDANIFKDVFAFFGFVDQERIMSHFVVGYLKTNGHRKGSILQLTNFSLVDYSEEKKVFRIHQVTRDAFRAELIERLNRHPASGDLLVENFRNISHFFFIGWDEKKYKDAGLFESDSYFHYVLSHHHYSLNDIISPDENLEVAGSLIFELRSLGNFQPSSLFKCSELEHFVARLLSALGNTKSTSYITITGCHLVHQCLQQNNQRDLSEEYAVKGVEIIKELVPESPELHTLPLLEKGYFPGKDAVSLIRFIQSVEPTDKEDRERLYLSLFTVATVLYRWNPLALSWLGYMFLKNGMLNGARVWFEEVVNRSCQSGGMGNQSFECVQDLWGLGTTYVHLGKYNAAEYSLLQARQHSTTVREQDSSNSRQSWPWLKYQVDRVLADVQIRLHKYSEALFSLEEVLDGYGILLHGNWTRCEKDDVGNHRIRVATDVLERYHSLYINVPDSLHETMRRVEHKLMELLAEILSCEYLKDLEEARRPADGRFIGPNKAYEELFRRLHHIIKNQILHNHTRNLTELTIGVAEILPHLLWTSFVLP